MLIPNPQALRGPYPTELRAVMHIAQAQDTRSWLQRWSQLAPQPTPLWSLPGLAEQLQLGGLSIKDESKRSPLGSFKALGAPAALVRLVLRQHPDWSADSVLQGQHAQALAALVVISATDGNHGRALAAAARSAGVRCVIVLHSQVSGEREQAIAAFGAEIVRVPGNYDASVAHAADLAQRHGWQVVSDTSYAGYEDIPRDVMQGYGVIADELVQQQDQPFTHVLLQGGVGGLAAGIVAYLWEHYGAQRPRCIVVEPEQADCLLQSAVHGRAASARGSVDSVMAGLACGETSPLAWRFLAPSVDAFMAITDAQAVAAMQVLAQGGAGDVPIVSGESGAAGFAGLQALAQSPAWRQQLGLDAQSRVLCINTEGATAPAIYQALCGQPADAVLQAQQAWLQRYSAK